MRATLKDIAQKVGVSSTTVSLALNGSKRISKDTKEKIEKVAEELQYYPNRLAASLATKRTKNIGVLMDSLNLYSAELVNGINKQALEDGYNIFQICAEPNNKNNDRYISLLMREDVEGVIIPLSAFSTYDELLICVENLKEVGIPAVVMDVDVGSLAPNCDCNDHVWGGYLGMKYLQDLGHKSIGIIASTDEHVSSVKRLEGCKKACLESETTFDDSFVFKGPYALETGFKAVPYLLGKGVTAIFAFNDMMALGVYKALKLYGKKIPDDISVLGYDDIFVAELLDTPLSTVHISIEESGKSAIKKLIEIIEEKPETEIEIKKPILMARASTSRLAN
jgi:LacI family transcriptional regulator